MTLDQSECDITWLVNGDAEEGKDYTKERLTWLWDVTTHADKKIIEQNALGVASRFYRPGPLSKMEEYTWQFLEWYLDSGMWIGKAGACGFQDERLPLRLVTGSPSNVVGLPLELVREMLGRLP